MWWNIDISKQEFAKKIFNFHQLKLGPPSLPIIGSLPFITIKRGLADFAMDSAVRFSTIMMCMHKQQLSATESRRLLWINREQATYNKQFWNPGDPAQTSFHRVARAPTSCRHQLSEDGKVDLLEHKHSHFLCIRTFDVLGANIFRELFDKDEFSGRRLPEHHPRWFSKTLFPRPLKPTL